MKSVTIQLDGSLWGRVQELAASSLVSPEAYLEDLVRTQVGSSSETEESAAITHKLEQLGYIDSGLDI